MRSFVYALCILAILAVIALVVTGSLAGIVFCARYLIGLVA